MLERMIQTIEIHRLLPEGAKVAVGVSGGVDSTALLHALHRLAPRYGWRVYAIHVNHGLRGEESEGDARYVRGRCEEWRIPFRLERVDVKGELEKNGGNPQSVARKLRYEAFHRAARAFGADHLALAHQADDQVETLLMRLLRGTGPSGLAGIPLVREWDNIRVVRPLLEIRRSEVEDYCAAHGLKPRLDSSNRDSRYTRNRIRHDLIPELKSYNPRFENALLQLAKVAADEEDHWRELVEKGAERVILHRGDGETVMDVTSLLELDVALQRRVIKLILNCLVEEDENDGVTLDSVERIRRLAARPGPSSTVPLFGEHRAEREYQRLRILKSSPEVKSGTVPSPGTTFLPVPGEIHFPAGRLRSRVESRWIYPPDDRRAVFDLDRLETPLSVRTRRPGDRIRPLGLDGTKKVKEIMIDAKVPRRLRDGIPLVLSGEETIWVPGLARSDAALVTEETRRFLYLEWDWEVSFPEKG
ncbi:tRNA(Ile)-lysidine synthase [Melghirimyces profundicolus]|uniref:tRNA(Ile)-lysidine synthase n=1 Tax=Melghirimyces profundicolus TaxID=1242148 RepID=A0A2T6BGQ7_9BACL|nr:tRNA lysidine(34) synthetase TilS [Melghirimyces profundicolus]PTX55255.1 tRNA(Ile)-lysidine synthase [Melghirimyces profundicolus]